MGKISKILPYSHSLNVGAYFFMLCFAAYNTIKFPIIDQSNRSYFLMVFYILTTLIALTRVTYFGCFVYLDVKTNDNLDLSTFAGRALVYTNTIASSLSMMLGV